MDKAELKRQLYKALYGGEWKAPSFHQSGAPVSYKEIVVAWNRMMGKPFTSQTGFSAARDILLRTNARRFSFEVDRARGLAFDAEEV